MRDYRQVLIALAAVIFMAVYLQAESRMWARNRAACKHAASELGLLDSHPGYYANGKTY